MHFTKGHGAHKWIFRNFLRTTIWICSRTSIFAAAKIWWYTIQNFQDGEDNAFLNCEQQQDSKLHGFYLKGFLMDLTSQTIQHHVIGMANVYGCIYGVENGRHILDDIRDEGHCNETLLKVMPNTTTSSSTPTTEIAIILKMMWVIRSKNRLSDCTFPYVYFFFSRNPSSIAPLLCGIVFFPTTMHIWTECGWRTS